MTTSTLTGKVPLPAPSPSAGVMCADYQPAQPADIVAHPGDPGGDRDLLRARRLCPLVRLRALLGRGSDRLAGRAHGAALGAAIRNRPLSGPHRGQIAGFG